MILLITILIIVATFFIGKQYALIAGLLAVIPVKIIATALFAYQNGGKASLSESLKGMLIGQFSVGIILLVVYTILERRL